MGPVSRGPFGNLEHCNQDHGRSQKGPGSEWESAGEIAGLARRQGKNLPVEAQMRAQVLAHKVSVVCARVCIVAESTDTPSLNGRSG